MVLSAGFSELALELQEAAHALTSDDVGRRVSDAVSAAHKGTDTYAYMVDRIGDHQAGDVIYRANGKTMRAPYAIAKGTAGAAETATVNTAKAKQVVARMLYEPCDQMAKESAEAEEAKEKAAREAAAAQPGAPIRIVESAGPFGENLQLTEAERTHYPVKIIAPGTGTTAHYPAKVLEASAGKFRKGTLMFWNHPTALEEAARPEGDLNNLAAILKTDARWDPAGPKGPGLYAEAAVMADYAQRISERAPHIGLSIRAGGKGSGRMVDGKPELASIDYVESVDYVTKAGRGGLALAEAARDAGLLDSPTQEEVSDMDANELKLLQEGLDSQKKTTLFLLEKELRRDAITHGLSVLEDIELPKLSKQRVVEAVMAQPLPKTADGSLDSVKLTEAFTAAAKSEGAYVTELMGGGRVFGMGPSAGAAAAAVTPESQALREAEAKKLDAKYLKVFEALLPSKAAAEFSLAGRPGAYEDDWEAAS